MTTLTISPKTTEIYFLIDSIKNSPDSVLISAAENKIREWFVQFNFSDLIQAFTTYYDSDPSSHFTIFSEISKYYLNNPSETEKSLLFNVITIVVCKDRTRKLRHSNLSELAKETNELKEKINLWQDQYSKAKNCVEESRKIKEKKDLQMKQALLRDQKIKP